MPKGVYERKSQKRSVIQKACFVCGKIFEAESYRFKRTKTCSVKCRHEYQKITVSKENHPLWNGGRLIDEDGYVLVRIEVRHYRKEHRLVMEKHLGRGLKRSEVVHHKNGDKSDNRIENLQLFEDHSAHMVHEHTGGK